MFDMSWGEVLVIGAVALIVIGPKDLPKALRSVGQVTSKLRRMAGEFQTQFNDAMREAELDEIRRQVESANQHVASLNQTTFNPAQTVRDELKGSIEGTTSSPAPASTPISVAEAAAAGLPAAPSEASATVVLPAAPAPAAEPAKAGEKRGAEAA